MEITDSLDLRMLYPVHQVPTHYADNINNFNLVIDLTFFQPDSVEVDNYLILPGSQYPLDHAPLTVNISINEKFIQDK